MDCVYTKAYSTDLFLDLKQGYANFIVLLFFLFLFLFAKCVYFKRGCKILKVVFTQPFQGKQITRSIHVSCDNLTPNNHP